MQKFRNIYRIPSTRLQNYDYGSNAAYFVTICTAGRENYFGEITDGNMVLSPIGEVAFNYWIDIPNHFPFVILDTFVIMPNHIHGIICINKPESDYRYFGVESVKPESKFEPPVETHNYASLHAGQNENSCKNKFGPQSPKTWHQ